MTINDLKLDDLNREEYLRILQILIDYYEVMWQSDCLKDYINEMGVKINV